MKKGLFVLLLASSVMLFSSCIWVQVNDSPKTYSMTFSNESGNGISDWYLRNRAGDEYSISDDFEIVENGYSSILFDIPEDDYQLYFCFYVDHYKVTNFVHIDRDVIYHLRSKDGGNFTYRSATGESTSEGQLVLVDSDGNEIPLN